MVNIDKIKRSFVGGITLFTLFIGIIGKVILHKIVPDYSFDGYLFTLLYFYVLGCVTIFMIDACRRRAPQRMVLLFLAIKTMKILLSVLLLIIYCVVIGGEIKVFLMTFISFYLLYMIYETCFFFTFERKLKLQKNKSRNETVA